MAKKRRSNKKQSYYNKEYDRLITHAKHLYNEMSLGGVFGSDLPSFEKILNYAGTRSGLKKPTKESLKALKKLKTESDILWGIEHTLNKRSPRYKENLEVLESLKEVDEKMQNALKTAQKDYNRENKHMSKEELYKGSFDLLNPVKGLLTQLQHLENYFTDHGLFYSRKNSKYANEQVLHYEYARNSVRKLIDEIENILNSGNMEKVNNLSKGCNNFKEKFPDGAEPQMFYKPEDGDDVRQPVFEYLNNNILDNSTPSEDSQDTPKEYADFIYDDFF